MKQKIIIPLNRPTLTLRDKNDFKKMAVSASGFLSGEVVEEFEARFAKYAGRKYGLAVNCGTSALHLALLALGIRRGDEIACPSYTCVALLNAINYIGAKPRLVDCNFDVKNGDFNISVRDLKKSMTGKTKAVIVPHMFGLPAEIDKISSLGVPIIEDGTQALGGKYRGKKIGSLGIISFFSLHSSKMMSTGAGGIFLTDSKKLFEKAKFFGDYESKVVSWRLKSPGSYKVQYNYKMSPVNAVLGVSQLTQIDEFVEKRRDVAKIYASSFKNAAEATAASENNVFWRYIIKVNKNPKKIIEESLKRGVELGRGVYPPLHRYLKIKASLFPNTEKAVSSVIAVPIYPSLDKKEIDYIIKIVTQSI